VIGDNPTLPVSGGKGETLYRWKTSSGYVWKYFGDKETQIKYEGEVENGVPNGLGVLIYPDGKSKGKEYKGNKYVGEWKKGKRNGYGTGFYPRKGERYKGGWKNGKPNGQGTHIHYGSKYVGEIKDWKYINGIKYKRYEVLERPENISFKVVNGKGTQTLTNGFKYIGSWMRGKKWNGIESDKNGNIKSKLVNGKWIRQLPPPLKQTPPKNTSKSKTHILRPLFQK